nr:fatty acid desaturase [Bacteroidota bacterium]
MKKQTGPIKKTAYGHNKGINGFHEKDWSNWIQIISLYNQPSPLKSWWQIANSLIPYIGLWILMIYSIEISYWLTLGLSVVASGFLVRIFIIFHDCGHGSFFKSPMLSRIVGIITGFMVFTPYHKWHWEHQLHHRTVGNLDKRGVGDVMTLTVEEFKNRPSRKQFIYRLYRNPYFLFVIAPFLLFTLLFRIPGRDQPPKIKIYTHLTTLGLVVAILLMSLWIGLKTFLLIQVPVLFFASVFGVWLFYVQHQYKDVVWERTENWDFKVISMTGCSYLKLPKLLQWFSGNIGFHHIHHLSPKIPNYNLEKCNKENPLFQIKPLTFLSSFQSAHYRLWDEEQRKLVGFGEIKP